MFPFKMKRFIQGPNLHEESISSQQTSSSSSSTCTQLSGDEAKQVYEEIISSVSGTWQVTSFTNDEQSTYSSSQKRKHDISSSSVHSSIQPIKILTLNQLMAFCETNAHSDLESYIVNDFSSSQKSKLDINEQDIYGWSLLMSAACAGANDCLQLLLRNGASPSLRDKKGLTAVDLAKKNGRKESVSILEEWTRLYGDRGILLIDLEEGDNDDDNTPTEPIFCEACNQSFINQKSHLKSIAHLFSSGVFNYDPEGKTHYGIPESNIGFQLMVKKGWNKSSGLGRDGQGHKFPIKTILKKDRQGVGNERDKKQGSRITHFGPFDITAIEGRIPREERTVTTEKKAEHKRKSREKRKEIHYRRQLS